MPAYKHYSVKELKETIDEAKKSVIEKHGKDKVDGLDATRRFQLRFMEMVATEIPKISVGVDKHMPKDLQERLITAAMDIVQLQIRSTYSSLFQDSHVRTRSALYATINGKMHRDINGDRYSQATTSIDEKQVSLRAQSREELAEVLTHLARTTNLSDYSKIFPALASVEKIRLVRQDAFKSLTGGVVILNKASNEVRPPQPETQELDAKTVQGQQIKDFNLESLKTTKRGIEIQKPELTRDTQSQEAPIRDLNDIHRFRAQRFNEAQLSGKNVMQEPPKQALNAQFLTMYEQFSHKLAAENPAPEVVVMPGMKK